MAGNGNEQIDPEPPLRLSEEEMSEYDRESRRMLENRLKNGLDPLLDPSADEADRIIDRDTIVCRDEVLEEAEDIFDIIKSPVAYHTDGIMERVMAWLDISKIQVLDLQHRGFVVGFCESSVEFVLK
ncbi:hypothetical protein BGZ63DRAFT_427162 [Mariannaea sp. PMI_226]|nr:hypothetical protein BGZ63DRAFT_427162 [Mariannaea sp. PMI_226]